jgi:hypothetical protein
LDGAPLTFTGPEGNIWKFFHSMSRQRNMTTKIVNEASIANPALQPFGVLVGEWQTSGSHPHLPGVTLHGRASCDWLENGAFVIMHSEIDHPDFPKGGVAIFGSDDAANKYFMLYFDKRGVSRKYDVAITSERLEWWRDDPSFSQRFIISIEEDGNKLVSVGEMSRDGAAWEKDLALTYARLK